MKFNNKFSQLADLSEEPNLDPTMTEQFGYRPAHVQIQELMESGQRLQLNRAVKYEFETGQKIPDDYFDPTRGRGFDIVEADRLRAAMRRHLTEAIEIQEARKKQESVTQDTKTAPVEGA